MNHRHFSSFLLTAALAGGQIACAPVIIVASPEEAARRTSNTPSSATNAADPQAAPDWVHTPDARFPPQKFIAGIGSGADLTMAENRAKALVAEVFSARIESSLTTVESETIADGSAYAMFQSSQQLIRASTRQRLTGVRIAESWKSPDGIFWAAAILDRIQVRNVLLSEIAGIDERLLRAERILDGREPLKISRVQVLLEDAPAAPTVPSPAAAPAPVPAAAANAPQPRSATRFKEVVIHAEDAFAALDAELSSRAPAASADVPPALPAQPAPAESGPVASKAVPATSEMPVPSSGHAAEPSRSFPENEGPRPATRLQTARFAREIADLLIRRSALNRQLRIVSPDGAMAAPAVDQIRLHDWSVAALRGLRVSLDASFSPDAQSLQTAFRDALAKFGFQLALTDESPDLVVRVELRQAPDILSQGWHIKSAALHVNIIDREAEAVLQTLELDGKQSSQIPEEASRRLWKSLASKISASMEPALGAALK